jgi:riboflavin kinase / FMN adenylyltransferase
LKVYRGTEELVKGDRAPAAVTVGNFYAVHRGHQALIRRVRARALWLGARSTVVTFEPHPQKILRGYAPPALVTPEGKLELLNMTGLDQVVILEFTPELSKVEPEEFIERILVGEINAKAIVVGSDFRFGRFARGDVTMLRSFGRKLGYAFETARMAEFGGQRISSTAIRHALEEGDVKWAGRALGRPYRLSGRVVPGSARGQQILGFPTANLEPVEGVCIPASGIYAGHALHNRQKHRAAISIGTNPTFGENPLSVEGYLLDFSGDLYGHEISFDFASRIRDHVAFEGPEALNEAIRADVREVRRTLSQEPLG